MSEYFPSEEAQQNILAEAGIMRRDNPYYPYISLPMSGKKAFCDHVINKAKPPRIRNPVPPHTCTPIHL